MTNIEIRNEIQNQQVTCDDEDDYAQAKQANLDRFSLAHSRILADDQDEQDLLAALEYKAHLEGNTVGYVTTKDESSGISATVLNIAKPNLFTKLFRLTKNKVTKVRIKIIKYFSIYYELNGNKISIYMKIGIGKHIFTLFEGHQKLLFYLIASPIIFGLLFFV